MWIFERNTFCILLGKGIEVQRCAAKNKQLQGGVEAGVARWITGQVYVGLCHRVSGAGYGTSRYIGTRQ